jgi:hypothetical protein
MGEAIWTTVLVGVAVIGVLMVVRGESRAWRVAGVAYGLGGLGFAVGLVLMPHPTVGTAADVAAWAEVIGGLLIFAGMLVTLIALGRRGRRTFLVVFGAATLTIATYQFWTTNWPARFGDVQTQCFNRGHGGGGTIQRVPPGLHCNDGDGTVFVPADGIAWLALAGWSTYYGFVIAFPVMGLAWAVRRRPPGRRLAATSNT